MENTEDHQGTEATALVLNIQRMSTEDGPGIRTTVFLKGCSLACDWCHNPESIDSRAQIVWHGVNCIGCKTCVGVCPFAAVSVDDKGLTVDRDLCSVCGSCAEECPTMARELVGKRWRLSELVDEVAKDRAYFERSGGGITVSGGEPIVQSAFAAALLEQCRAAGLHTVLDTCGMGSEKRLLAVSEHADIVLYDLKLADSEAHQRHTGQDNGRIMLNLLALRDQMRRSGTARELWIRTPLIPGVTATEDNIRRLGEFIASNLGDSLSRWELCAFNNLCGDKYDRLGLEWTYGGRDLMTRRRLARLGGVAKAAGVDGGRIYVTGASRLEK